MPHGHIRPLNPGLNGLAMAAALLGDVVAAEQAAAEAGRHPPIGVLCGARRLVMPRSPHCPKGNSFRPR
jgi:hypothetical protein